MSDDKGRRLCTIDHAGKQLEARDWNEHRYWLELVRRRRLELEREQRAAERRERRRAG